MSSDSHPMQAAWRRHERRWADNRYVYAVVSRRSGGVSVGINLNPGKECNFDCVYCQVDRNVPAVTRNVDLARVSEELDRVLTAERDGSLYAAMPFSVLGPDRRGVRDIAFSGDGEPTTFKRFGEAVALAAEARKRFNLDATKLVLITDSAYLTKPAVCEALRTLDANNGEVWAKLDAGTEEYFRLIDRPNVPLRTILDNIAATAALRPVVIQTLWLRLRHSTAAAAVGTPPEWATPPTEEVEAYCARLNELLATGAQLKAIQMHTIARAPAETFVAPLVDAELDAIAAFVAARVPVAVEKYYGVAQ